MTMERAEGVETETGPVGDGGSLKGVLTAGEFALGS
jgi:hypothetical protein